MLTEDCWAEVDAAPAATPCAGPPVSCGQQHNSQQAHRQAGKQSTRGRCGVKCSSLLSDAVISLLPANNHVAYLSPAGTPSTRPPTSAVLCPAAASSWLSSPARLPVRSILRLPPSTNAMASPYWIRDDVRHTQKHQQQVRRGATLARTTASVGVWEATQSRPGSQSSPQHSCRIHWGPQHS